MSDENSEQRDELSLEELNAVNNLIMEGDHVDEMMIAEYNRKQQRLRLFT
jgi:hypothetical protein